MSKKNTVIIIEITDYRHLLFSNFYPASITSEVSTIVDYCDTNKNEKMRYNFQCDNCSFETVVYISRRKQPNDTCSLENKI